MRLAASDPGHSGAHITQAVANPDYSGWRDIMLTVVLVGALWTASSAAYGAVLSAFGFRPNYNDSPVAVAIYYAAWSLLALAVFNRQLSEAIIWRGDLAKLAAIAAIAMLFALFASYAPLWLPQVAWHESWQPPDILVATPAYFLPKSVDILFQQFLIIALVVTLARNGFGLRAITVVCMILFGGTHLLLALSGMPLLYVARFTISATLFAVFFPTLILRVRDGFVYSYGVHWLYYAVTLITARTISPYVS